ncbi:MAG: PD-(D/E)XK nuclease family protein [Bacteroidales bacterium]|nr:PD-(D/E)XK nuclease family protein [Bacteroidales bacterium]
MVPFLHQVAQRIADAYPKDTDRVLVVFNNNRSKRFFINEFERLGRLMFLPTVKTIDELVSDLGELEVVPNEFLLFELYDIHVQLGGPERKYNTFEDFISFGDLMVGDFSEIDQYMVDARRLFSHIHDEKELGEWKVDGSALTPFQVDYLDFYRSLFDYYSLLRERLLKQHKAYNGMAYRHVAEHISTLATPDRWQAVYFIGFNAMSECERLIISHYQHLGIGHLLTDYDAYYLADEQEAGLFLRRHKEHFPELQPPAQSVFAEGTRKIHLVECPENIMQCKFAGHVLSGGSTSGTALVLADESLLMPALGALPEEVGANKVNISMGYAFADSMVHALALKVLSLYRRKSPRGYYHADVLALAADHHIAAFAGTGDFHRRLEHHLQANNIIRCTAADLVDLLPEQLRFLLPDESPAPQDCVDLLQRLASLIAQSDILATDGKERQALGSLNEVLANLHSLLISYPFVTNIETLEKVYTRIARRHQIALVGEPMSGLQILGVLETRNLDFDRVILLSANEGVIPGGRSGNTLVPQHLKVHYGLPTYYEKDSVYAYNFYHLLQRASEVYLVYSSESEAMGKGEPSRFLRQVETELAPRFGIEVDHIVVGANTALTAGTPPTLGRKTDAVMRRLCEMGAKGLFPTSFADFIDCPLKFYFARLLGISERRALDEELDAADLGDAVHNVLQHIYQPLLHQPLREADIQAALELLPTLLQTEFDRLYSHGRTAEGHNRFLYSVAESQLGHLLENELATLRGGHTLQIEATEENITPYAILTAPDGSPVNIKGKVDRVDIYDGRLRVIDYKTGSLDDKEITFANPMPGKWLQLMWYALVYTKSHPLPAAHASLLAGIYPLRNLRSDVRLARWDADTAITPDRLDLFEQMLRDKIEELMNPEQDFVATPSKTACKYCPAKTFCDSKMT